MGKKKQQAITPAEIERVIHLIRGQRVMLDSDLANLYGVTTSRLNEQLLRNKERFPHDFAFQLTQQEFTALISQIATSKSGRGGRRKRPWVFTEQGVAMLSSVLRSPTATNLGTQQCFRWIRAKKSVWLLLCFSGAGNYKSCSRQRATLGNRPSKPPNPALVVSPEILAA